MGYCVRWRVVAVLLLSLFFPAFAYFGPSSSLKLRAEMGRICQISFEQIASPPLLTPALQGGGELWVIPWGEVKLIYNGSSAADLILEAATPEFEGDENSFLLRLEGQPGAPSFPFWFLHGESEDQLPPGGKVYSFLLPIGRPLFGVAIPLSIAIDRGELLSCPAGNYEGTFSLEFIERW